MESQKPNLLILTAHYPCGEGEEFVGQELPYLTERFHVSIVTADRSSDITRTLPKGVTFTRMPSVSWIGTVIDRLRARFSSQYRMQTAEDKQKGIFSPDTRRAVLQALASSFHAARYIQQLDEFSSPAPLAICSCQYNQFAYAGVLVKNIRKKRGVGACATVRCHQEDLDVSMPLSACIDDGMDVIYCDGEAVHADYIERYARSNHFSKYRIAQLGTSDPGGLSPKKTEDDLFFRIATRGLEQEQASLLIKALAQITEGNFYWTHLGTQKENLDSYREQAASLKWNDHISYEILEPVSHAQTVEFYRSTAVDIFLTLGDSVVTPTLEAMSCGIFPIALDSGFGPELVNDDYGLLLPSDITAEELAKVLMLLSRMAPEKMVPQRARARKRWEKYYCSERNHQKFAQQLAADAERISAKAP